MFKHLKNAISHAKKYETTTHKKEKHQSMTEILQFAGQDVKTAILMRSKYSKM